MKRRPKTKELEISSDLAELARCPELEALVKSARKDEAAAGFLADLMEGARAALLVTRPSVTELLAMKPVDRAALLIAAAKLQGETVVRRIPA